MKMQRHHQTVVKLCAFFWAISLFFNLSRAAETPAETKSGFVKFLEQDYLLGDWGGLRTEWSKKGIDFEFFYAASLPDNLDGGIRSGAIYQGAFLMMLDLDSQKLAGYDGGELYFNPLLPEGEETVPERHLG